MAHDGYVDLTSLHSLNLDSWIKEVMRFTMALTTLAVVASATPISKQAKWYA